MLKIRSVCLSGYNEFEMPYPQTSKKHEKLEKLLTEEITQLVRDGYSEFFVCGQSGIDEVVSMIILSVRDQLFSTLNLNIILPYRGMEQEFTTLQKDNFEYIMKEATSVKFLNESYTVNCIEEANQFILNRTDLLLVVCMSEISSHPKSIIGLAKEKKVDIIQINPVTFRIKRSYSEKTAY